MPFITFKSNLRQLTAGPFLVRLLSSELISCTLDLNRRDSLCPPWSQGPFPPWIQSPPPPPPRGTLASWSQPGWLSVTTSQLRRRLLGGLGPQHISGGHSSTYPSHPPVAPFTDEKTEDPRNLCKPCTQQVEQHTSESSPSDWRVCSPTGLMRFWTSCETGWFWACRRPQR